MHSIWSLQKLWRDALLPRLLLALMVAQSNHLCLIPSFFVAPTSFSSGVFLAFDQGSAPASKLGERPVHLLALATGAGCQSLDWPRTEDCLYLVAILSRPSSRASLPKSHRLSCPSKLDGFELGNDGALVGILCAGTDLLEPLRRWLALGRSVTFEAYFHPAAHSAQRIA